MRTNALLIVAAVAVCALALSLESAVAHYWVPQYDGAAWGASCLAPAPPGTRRVSPATCCEFARSYCTATCGLTAVVDDAWKNACRANCQAAGAACLQRVQHPNPLTDVTPGTRPPARTN